jgi:trimethylamine---corrinoid protein Co-methyltransferase
MGDAQSGHEKTLTAMLPALAGANLIYGLGMLESGVTFDYGQLVMDDEVAAMIKHVVAGIPVDDETLAVDDIARVGSFGDFLSLDATLRHMREQSQPRLIDRRVREDWTAAGATDLHDRARARALEILASHHPDPLPVEVAEQIGRIVAGAEEEMGVAAAT